MWVSAPRMCLDGKCAVMSQTKTKPTDADVVGFPARVKTERKAADALILAQLFSKVTEFYPRMWSLLVLCMASTNFPMPAVGRAIFWQRVFRSARRRNLSTSSPAKWISAVAYSRAASTRSASPVATAINLQISIWRFPQNASRRG